MAVFGRKAEGGGTDESDFVRIPPGTRIGAGPEGKMLMAFAGDMSFGESVPELSELNCGRNLWIDPGVTLRADVVRVKGTFEINAGARLLARELEAERIISHKGSIEARNITAGQVELEGSRVTAERLSAREAVYIDRGEMEIGAIVAPALTITKGTVANILVTEVAKLEGAISKGGFENFADFLARAARYHPEILNDRFAAEARRPAGAAPSPEVTEDALGEPAVLARVLQEGQRLKALYGDREMPREVGELVSLLDHEQISEVRKQLGPIYQRLSTQGKVSEPVLEVFREIQRILREAPRGRKEARPA